MELKEGMYVRTKDGIIGKYNVIKEFANVLTFNGYCETKEVEREYIDDKPYGNHDVTKASYNIIDLIEVGDYVNGYRVDEVEHSKSTIFIGNTEKVIEQALWSNDIKSIVTKEQFESMQYKVEE